MNGYLKSLTALRAKIPESSENSSANIDQPHGFPFKLIRETPLFVPTSFRREPGTSAVATGGQPKVFHFLYY